MSQNTTVSLTLQIKGNAGQELKRMADDQVRSTSKINQQWTQIGSEQAKFVQTAKAGTQATVNTARAGDQLLRTNRMLEGVLRQQAIQTKIQSQQFKQQQASAQQIASWMKQVEQSSKRTQQSVQHTTSLWQKGAALTGAAVAGGMVASSALQKPRDYDQQLTYITATATGGKNMSTADRLASRGTLNQYVKDAVRTGGGTREDVAAALNELIASGQYDLKTVSPALKSASKTAFAAGADTVEAAKMTIAMQNFGVKNLELAQDRAMRAGQVGSFEYKDMAKFLPEQMTSARSAGYSGDEGLIKLLSLNQVAKTTAADSATAGNNVVNLLQKLSSREFSDSIADAVSVNSGDPTRTKGTKKPKQVFDWTTYSQEQRQQGVYGVEAFVKLLERQLAGDARYQKLQKEAQAAKTPEQRKAILGDMSNIALGSNIGQIIADRQALMAALAAVYNKDKSTELEGKIRNAAGTVNADSEMVRSTEWAKDQALNQEKLFAQSKAYDAISGSLGNVKDKIVDWASDNEKLAASAYSASVALTALAAAGTAGAILSGKGGAMAGKVGGAVTSAAGRVAGGIATAARAGGPTLAVAGAGAVGYGIGSVINMGLEGTKTGDNIGEAVTKIWAALGSESAKEALEAQAKYDQMIAQQEQNNQYSRELIGNIKTLINVTSQNKPVFNFPGSPLMQSMSSSAGNEEKRHGAPPAYLMRK